MTPIQVGVDVKPPLVEAREAHREGEFERSCSAALISIAQSLETLASPRYSLEPPKPNPDIDRL